MKSLLIKVYSLVLRRLPIAGGQTRLAFNALTRWLYHGHARSSVAHQTNGFAIRTDVHDYHGRILHLFGVGDIKVAELTEGLLRPGDCFFDIGANYGSIGFSAARRVGTAGQVHFIEPQPRIAAALREAIQLDDAGLDIQVHEAAASDHDGTMTLHCAPHHTGVATLEPSSSSGRKWTPIEIPVLSTDSLLKLGIAERDFGAKIDIEGHEPTVLPILLAHPRCRFVIFEACNNAYALTDICSRADFAVFGLCRRLLRRRLARIDEASALSAHHDAVAVPRRRLSCKPPNTCSYSRLAQILQ